MSKIVLDVSVSLDGFTTGPNVGPEVPMGEGGERLHDWMFDDGPDRALRTEGDAIGGPTSSDGAPSTSAWSRGAVRRGPACPPSWSPTGPGRTYSVTTAGRSPSTDSRPRSGEPRRAPGTRMSSY